MCTAVPNQTCKLKLLKFESDHWQGLEPAGVVLGSASLVPVHVCGPDVPLKGPFGRATVPRGALTAAVAADLF